LLVGLPAMTANEPDALDYLALFRRYAGAEGFDFGKLYLQPDDERFGLLFRQVCQLLVKPSSFNRSMPQEFPRTAHRYLGGDPKVVAHMGAPQMRHFMLSDLYDYVHLSERMGATWLR
jgi:hypothetical protein